MRRNPRASAALATFFAALVLFGSIRAYRVASERAAIDTFWARYQEAVADVERMEREVARTDLSLMDRAETYERLVLRVNDARSLAGALLGLTRGRPDPRVINAVTSRLRHDLDQAMTDGNFVRAKVMAQTRLELIRQLEGQLEWPEADIAFLRESLDAAIARIAAAGR